MRIIIKTLKTQIINSYLDFLIKKFVNIGYFILKENQFLILTNFLIRIHSAIQRVNLFARFIEIIQVICIALEHIVPETNTY